MAANLQAQCFSAARQICEECDAVLGTDAKDVRVTRTLGACGEPLVQLLGRQASILLDLYEQDVPATRQAASSSNGQSPRHGNREKQLLLKRLDDIISIAYAKFYAYLYKDLPLCWRQLYTDASILKFSLLFFKSAESRTLPGTQDWTPAADALDDMIKTLDLALILAGGGGSQRGRPWIDKALAFLQHLHAERQPISPIDDDEHRPAKRTKFSPPSRWSSTSIPRFSDNEPFTPPVKTPIRRMKPMSLDEFQNYLEESAEVRRGPEPLIFSHLTDDWPARTTNPWDKPAYLLSQTLDGRRLVPVEVGRSYVDEGWGQKIIPFHEFLQQYVDHSTFGTAEKLGSPQTRPVAYLAQHQLFNQLPQLRNDILVPDYCYTAPPPHPTDPSQDQPELEAPMLNAWFGPPGTITPLHTDPYHNLLVQVVGRKYVRLYSPLQTDRMLARGKEAGVEMGNTSAVDVGVVEGWDAPPEDGVCDDGQTGPPKEWQEKFREIPFVDCILDPGDTLYIPIGWWHYVRGLSVSFSVSFWWN